MSYLRHICRSTDTTERDTEQETATKKLMNGSAGRLNAGSDDNEGRSSPHTPSSAKVVVHWSSEEDSAYVEFK